MHEIICEITFKFQTVIKLISLDNTIKMRIVTFYKVLKSQKIISKSPENMVKYKM